jgi:hypothetical protein
MKALGYLLAACVALAALKTVLAALLLACFLGILVGLFYRPRETFGFLIFMLLAGLVQQHGAAALALLAMLATLSALRR